MQGTNLGKERDRCFSFFILLYISDLALIFRFSPNPISYEEENVYLKSSKRFGPNPFR